MILVIDKNKQSARTSAEMFHFMGILARGTTPSEALSKIGIEYRAVIITFPETIADLKDFVRRLRRYSSSVPIFALTKSYVDNDEVFDAVYDFDILSSTLIKHITKYCSDNSLPYVGSYKLAGIEASADIGCVIYKNQEISLTKTEKMILRYLIRTYPVAKSPAEILKHAFRESRAPLAASVRTHVHQINKKLSQVPGAPIIESRGGEGYVIKTPVLEELVSNAF